MCSAPFLLHLINGSCGSVMVHADRLASLEAMTTGSWLILGGNVLIFQKRCTRSCTKQRIIPAYRNARRGDFGLVVQLNWSKKNSYASNFPFRFTSTSFEHLTADKPRLNSRGSGSGLLDSGGNHGMIDIRSMPGSPTVAKEERIIVTISRTARQSFRRLYVLLKRIKRPCSGSGLSSRNSPPTGPESGRDWPFWGCCPAGAWRQRRGKFVDRKSVV